MFIPKILATTLVAFVPLVYGGVLVKQPVQPKRWVNISGDSQAGDLGGGVKFIHDGLEKDGVVLTNIGEDGSCLDTFSVKYTVDGKAKESEVSVQTLSSSRSVLATYAYDSTTGPEGGRIELKEQCVFEGKLKEGIQYVAYHFSNKPNYIRPCGDVYGLTAMCTGPKAQCP